MSLPRTQFYQLEEISWNVATSSSSETESNSRIASRCVKLLKYIFGIITRQGTFPVEPIRPFQLARIG